MKNLFKVLVASIIILMVCVGKENTKASAMISITPDCIDAEWVYSPTIEGLQILYRIVEAEATDGTYDQKRNVASCILARVEHHWADSIEGVVFQKKQFSPIDDGRYYTVSITQSTIDAVNDVLKNGLVHHCDYFCTSTCGSANGGFHSRLDFQFYDGMHNYYK